jgi:hypothetical protein
MAVTPAFFASKHPDETELRAIDWSAALIAGDTISTSTWSVTPSGLTLASPLVEGNVARIRVSGGNAGSTYQIKNTVTTAQGLVLVEIVPMSISVSTF